MDPPARSFAAATALRAAGSGRFRGDVHPEWTVFGRPNGGYLLTMLGRASVAVAAHRHVLAASAHYFRPPEPGGVDVEAEVLRAGRSASQVRARLLQGGATCVECLVTTADLAARTAPHWDAGLPSPDFAPFAACERVPSRTPDGHHVAIMELVEVRIDPGTAGFLRAEPAGRGELRGWLALPGGEPFDHAALLFAVDSFPPATFDVERSGWVPTLELTAYVRALPSPGPLRVLQRAHLVQDQRVDEACFVWDSAGVLVAQSTQLAAVRLG